MKSILKIIISILFGIVLLEAGLRVTGIFKVYSEKLGGKYESYFDEVFNGYYYIIPPNQMMEYEAGELTISYWSNSWGMRNPEFEVTKNESTTRIICMGDSFTEGDGALDGYEYPRQLEKILHKNFPSKNIEVINAGKNANDILFIEKRLTQELYALSPDIVIIAINSSDIDDIIQRGGYLRFKPDNTTRFKKAPWYHEYYIKSHVFRMFIHVILQKNHLFLNKKERKLETKRAVVTIEKSIKNIRTFCENNNIKPYFIIHPVANTNVSIDNKGKLSKHEFTNKFCLKEERLNMFKTNEAISLINICKSLVDTFQMIKYETYAWPINGHFNHYGYNIMAEEIFKIIEKDI
jgi:lysophospholipase L1-like esterase